STISLPHSLCFFLTLLATTDLYTLSLHDALPIFPSRGLEARDLSRMIDRDIAQRLQAEKVPPSPLAGDAEFLRRACLDITGVIPDRKSTRLNSSHVAISYAVFCLKKKKKTYRLII